MAVRTKLRALSEAYKENGKRLVMHGRLMLFTNLIIVERFYLVYWPRESEEEDECVSVHPSSEMTETPEDARTVGSSCLVLYKKKLYTGKIAAIGKRTFMRL